ncbi:protein Spindly-like, partial [Diretmus argenteus]
MKPHSMGEEVQRLRKELEEMDDRCQQAAKAGLDLVHQNVELQGRLEEQRVDMTNALEALEQDKYSLQKEVELKGRMLESLQSDYDYVKSQQSQQLQRQLDHLERNHRLVLNELNNTVVRLQSELEESQLSERQLSHKLEVQTDVLKSKVEEIRALNEQTQVSKSSEVMEGEIRRMELENAK